MGNDESQETGSPPQAGPASAEDPAKERVPSDKPRPKKEIDIEKLTPDELLSLEQDRVKELQKDFGDAHPDDLLRFLRARQLVVKDATAMYLNYQKWRDDFRPLECEDTIFRQQLAGNRVYLIRHDDVPIIYFVLRNHDQDVFPLKDTVRFGVYLAELLLQLVKGPELSSWIMLVNCREVGMKNIEMKLISTGIDYYQNYFPERMKACYVFGLPTPLLGIWSIIQKLMDERTRNKIQLLKRADVAQMFPVVPKELTPVELRGELAELNHDAVIKAHEDWQKKQEKEKSATANSSTDL